MSYASQQRAALGKIRRKGLQTIVSRKGVSQRDVVNQAAAGPVAPTSQPVVCVVMPATVDRDATLDQIQAVRQKRRSLTLAALKPDGSPLDFELADNQTIALEGDTWRLAGVSKTAPDGATAVLYQAEAVR